MVITELTAGKREALTEIMARNGACRIRLFGSFAEGNATDDSDVDLLVDLEPGRDFLDLVGLKFDLEVLLGRNVDVVEEEGLSPYLRDHILATAVEI